MPAPIVFFDIAGPDAVVLRAFYADVFDWDINPAGLMTPGNSAQLNGAIRQDPADKVLYIGVSDISATLDKIVAAGGAVDTPRFEVPGTVILGLFIDPAGNRMGLVEMVGDTPSIP